MDTIRHPAFAGLAAFLLLAAFTTTGCGSRQGDQAAQEKAAETAAGAAEKAPAGHDDHAPAVGNVVEGSGEGPTVTPSGDVAITKHEPGTSEPLPSEVMKVVNMEDEEVQLDPATKTLGRKVAEIEAFVVERPMFGIKGDEETLYTFTQMESLQAAGALNDVKTFARFQRSIIHGDRAAVEGAIQAGNVNWYAVPAGETYPHNGINKAIAAKTHEGHNH